MNNKKFKTALEEAAMWHKYATEYELESMPISEARDKVLLRIFEKYKDCICK